MQNIWLAARNSAQVYCVNISSSIMPATQNHDSVFPKRSAASHRRPVSPKVKQAEVKAGRYPFPRPSIQPGIRLLQQPRTASTHSSGERLPPGRSALSRGLRMSTSQQKSGDAEHTAPAEARDGPKHLIRQKGHNSIVHQGSCSSRNNAKISGCCSCLCPHVG